MIIERCFDYDLINSILTDPVIFKTIAEDGHCKREEFKTLESDDVYYLVPKVNGEAIGVFIFHPDSKCSYELHANMLKQYRKQYSRKAVRAALDWFFKHNSTNKVNCEIPIIYENVINCAEDCGFKVEGIRRNYYVKNGECLNVILFGMLRGEL